MEIASSILSVEKENAIQTFYNLEISKIDYFHIDVMDGKFVKNDTSKIMKEYTECIKNISNLNLDIHLMVENVKEYIDEYLSFQPNKINVHIETIKDNVEEIIKYIKENDVRVGLAINPETAITEILNYLPLIHTVMVMSVHPGEGGQAFIEESLEKIKEIKRYIQDNNLETEIEVDGGINIDNIRKVENAGADIAVVGSYLIKSKDYKYAVKNLRGE